MTAPVRTNEKFIHFKLDMFVVAKPLMLFQIRYNILE